jgi:hypothetical protein
MRCLNPVTGNYPPPARLLCLQCLWRVRHGADEVRRGWVPVGRDLGAELDGLVSQLPTERINEAREDQHAV